MDLISVSAESYTREQMLGMVSIVHAPLFCAQYVGSLFHTSNRAPIAIGINIMLIMFVVFNVFGYCVLTYDGAHLSFSGEGYFKEIVVSPKCTNSICLHATVS